MSQSGISSASIYLRIKPLTTIFLSFVAIKRRSLRICNVMVEHLGMLEKDIRVTAEEIKTFELREITVTALRSTST